ncbi:MAG TPA: methyltransferase domain-containing protein [Candidatus Methylacidiphilales bacterium]|nr:methyltransferase domain-containing protein [Candidatus Methylacidiphilales bacterium]
MELFNKDFASVYDARFVKLAPQKDALHLLMRIIFGELPERARILCVGVGTGAELFALARVFPHLEFTAVDPSQPMLEICEKRAHEEGIASRCTFHNGYIETLPQSDPFNAATSLLVSQFLVRKGERIAFFRTISQHLRPGGVLINADLSGDLDSPDSDGLKRIWQKMLLYNGAPQTEAAGFLEGWKKHVAVLPPSQVEEIIAAGGFEKPSLIYQSLFIHGWFAKRQEVVYSNERSS